MTCSICTPGLNDSLISIAGEFQADGRRHRLQPLLFPQGREGALFHAIKPLLKQPVVIHGRNLYEPALMKSLGFE